MFAYSMATRRTKRTRQKRTRKGGNWLTQKARRLGLYNKPSTSLLAREIYAMLGPHDIKEERVEDFNVLMRENHGYDKKSLFADLEKLGVDKVYQLNIRNRLNHL